ncbi:MAG: D-serine dehydratase, partial [Proteus hauseri]|nr:D-serine dehydratase [Proteus hauseri]
ERLIDGYYTIDDQELYDLLSLLNKEEGIKLEPSALAGMTGAVHVTQAKDYLQGLSLDSQKMQNATHLVWATGGGMVPADEMQKYLAQGK